MHLHFHSKKYNTGYRVDIKELPTNTQLDAIKKEVQERIKIQEENMDYPHWLDIGDICAEVTAKYLSIGHNTHIATIEID